VKRTTSSRLVFDLGESSLPVTIKAYYRAHRSLFGYLAGFVGVTPVLSKLLPDSLASFIFPPLNDTFRFLSLLIVVLTSVVIFRFSDSSFVRNVPLRPKLQIGLLLIVVLGASAYVAAHGAFVRVVDRPSQGDTVTTVVGYERTPFAMREFAVASDWDVLRNRGVTDEEVFRSWTMTSVIVARVSLFLSYALVLIASIALLSFEVLYGLL
jgi:hypothetical protein